MPLAECQLIFILTWEVASRKVATEINLVSTIFSNVSLKIAMILILALLALP